VGVDEVLQMGSQLVQGLVEVAFASRVLDSAVRLQPEMEFAEFRFNKASASRRRKFAWGVVTPTWIGAA
jgi:hypothetical protein